MEHGREVKRRPQSSSIPAPRFVKGFKDFCITMEDLILAWCDRLSEISDLGNATCKNSQTHWNFKAGKSTSRLKHVQHQRFLTSLCIGSKKLAKSTDDLMTSQSLDFTDFEMLDAMMASALKKLLTCALPKKSKCRRGAR